MKKTSKTITLISAIITLCIGLYSLTWPYSASAIATILWALSPYLLLAMLINLVSNKPAKIAALIITCLTCILGLALLVDATFIHIDAQGDSMFIYVPLWQWAGLIMASIPLTLLNIAKKAR